MKATTKTPTTFEQYSTWTGIRRIITALRIQGDFVVCAVETITPDGRNEADKLTSIHREGVPRSILDRLLRR